MQGFGDQGIPQCEQCSAALLYGYCEMKTALTEERLRLCFDCAKDELAVKRALELDDLLKAGIFDRPF